MYEVSLFSVTVWFRGVFGGVWLGGEGMGVWQTSQQGRLVPPVVQKAASCCSRWVSMCILFSPFHSCDFLLGFDLRLGWTFSVVRVTVQKKKKEMLHLRGRYVLEVLKDCFDFAPLVATVEDTDRSLFCHIWSGKCCSFNFLGSYRHESKYQRTGISLRTHHFFLTALWMVHDWEGVQSNLRQLSTLLLSQKHQIPA